MSSGSDVPQKGAKIALRSEEMKTFLEEKYLKEKLSTYEIARIIGQTHSMVRRLLVFHNIPLRTHQEAQSLAIEKGKNHHPTKGRERSEEEKTSIAAGMAKVWKGLTEEQREMRADISKRQWELMSEGEREMIARKAHAGLLETSKKGSKIERHLMVELRARGFEVEFHRQFLFDNDKMHIDLFLPDVGVAIECDGVFHYKAVYSEVDFQKTILADQKKNGAIISAGYRLLRIRQYANTMTRYLLAQATEKVLDNLKGPAELVTIEVGEKKG